MSSIGENLIEATRSAMTLPEREGIGAFLWFWFQLVLIAACPVALAALLSMAVLGTTDRACWSGPAGTLPQTCSAAAPRSAGGTFIAQGAALPWGAGAAAPQAAAFDETTELSLYRARLVFGAALAFFWVLGLSVLYAQTQTCLRQWRVASFDRCANTDYSLQPQPFWPLVFLVTMLSGVAAFVLGGPFVVVLAAAVAGFFVQVLLVGSLPGLTWTKSVQPPGAEVSPGWQPYLGDAPLAVLPLTLVTGLVLGSLALAPFEARFLPVGGPLDLAIWARAVFIASLTLLFAVIMQSGMLIRSASRELPSRGKACMIARGALEDPFRAKELAGKLWQEMLDHMRETIGDARLAPEEARGNGLHTPALNAKEARFLFPPNPSFSISRAAVFDKVARLATLPLSLTMGLSLVVLGLGIDLLHFAPGADKDLAAARDQSEAALILLLGLGLTVSLAAIVVPALVRLDVFNLPDPPASTPGKKPLRLIGDGTRLGAILKGAATDGEVELLRLSRTPLKTEAEEAPEGPPDATFVWPVSADGRVDTAGHPDATALHEVILSRHIGAGEKKFADIIGANSIFAAFQDVLGKDLKAKAIAIATGLAPSAFPAVLELIK